MPYYTNLQGWQSGDLGFATKTITLSFAPSAGSLLVMFGVAAATFSTPTGWTRGPEDVGSWASVVFTKVSNGSETEITWTQNGPRSAAAVVYEFPAGTTVTNQGAWVFNANMGTESGLVAASVVHGTFIRCCGATANIPDEVTNRLSPTGDLIEDSEMVANATSNEDSWIWCGHKDFTAGGDVSFSWSQPAGSVTAIALNMQLTVPADVVVPSNVGQFYPGGGSGGGGGAGHVVQDEGSDLEARANLNFVGEGVVASDDAANDATLVTIPGGGGGGTTILNGSGPPNAALGDVGDYYLDETADILYGPKNDGLPTYGPNQTLYTSESPTTSAFGSGRTVASQFTFAAKGRITALKWSRPSANSFTTHTFKVWKASDQSLLATVSSSGETGTQVLTLPLSTPVAVTAGMVLRIGIDLTDGQTLHLYPESSVAAGGIINGDITMAKTPYDVQPYGSYPNNAFSNHVFVEPVFQKETSPGNEWPVAIEGGGGGGGGAMTYSIAPPSNPSTGDVWIEKSA